ncbi:hypothetical protein [Paenibacillus herberti]|uniref:hypothetical protein n=1 Tax=Paenibacillus herberti TaxID=1619309 RepID=UPI001131C054|nr:hypothetical protein [Paenibacillus herberti]
MIGSSGPLSAQSSNFDYLIGSSGPFSAQASSFDYFIGSSGPLSAQASSFDYLIGSSGLLPPSVGRRFTSRDIWRVTTALRTLSNCPVGH